MAQEQGGAPYQFTPQGGKPGNSSRDYTGQGYAQYPNGDQYYGDYIEGIRQGKGKYIYVNGDRYQGDFKNNNKHGIGKLTYKQKGQYYGQWQNGVKHGQGTYQYINKDTYAGWWQFGKKQGKGTYTYSQSGMKLVGEWKDNNIQQGRWIFPNGTYYQGKFNNNKPNGEGVWHYPNNNTLKGCYKQAIIPNEDEQNKTINIKLDWQSQVGISQSAWKVNAHQTF